MVIHKTHRLHLSTTIDARAVRTRQTLRRTMIELLERRSFDDLTIGDVAEAAGVGYSTVCRHYPTLSALLDEIAKEEIARVLSQAFPSFDVTDTHTASVALFRHVHEHRAVWSALLNGGASGALRQEFLRITMRFASAWNRTTVWLPRELGATMTISGILELMTWWLKQPEPLPVEEVARIFERLLVAPLLSDVEAKKAVTSGIARRARVRNARKLHAR